MTERRSCYVDADNDGNKLRRRRRRVDGSFLTQYANERKKSCRVDVYSYKLDPFADAAETLRERERSEGVIIRRRGGN